MIDRKQIFHNAKWLMISIMIVVVDQAIKAWVGGYPEMTSIARFSPVFEIIRTQNSGAAFSILTGKGLLLLALTTAMLLGLLFLLVLSEGLTNCARSAIAVLLGGGVGNWIDRLFFGSVTDYIRPLFIRFPVFNLADICITVAALWILVLLLSGRLETHMGDRHGTGD